MLFPPEAPLLVPNTEQGKPVDGEIAGLSERHQRAALHHEPVEVSDAFFSDAAVVLGPDRRPIQSIDDFAGTLIGDDHHVEPIAQLTLADVVVMELRHLEFVLLQNPPGPPLIDVFSSPRGVETDPWQ